MRTIYLIRHGLPDFSPEDRMCLGRTDLPLGTLGSLQAALAGAALRNTALTAVFTSPLGRCRETAAFLPGPAAVVVPGLVELDAGAWDGLPFSEIRRRWPELFAARGTDLSLQPPGAESLESGRARFRAAMEEVLSRSSGDIAVVAHAGVFGLFLGPLVGAPTPQGPKVRYGSVSRVYYTDGVFSIEEADALPHPALDAALCHHLLAAAKTPEPVIRHCLAVAAEAERIARTLTGAGHPLDLPLVTAGALLHDMARGEPDHPARGACYLRELGYPEVAAVVEKHHDAACRERLDEAAVLYLADKLVEGERNVSLSERFAGSRGRCADPEALAAHEARYDAALAIAQGVNGLCGAGTVRI